MMVGIRNSIGVANQKVRVKLSDRDFMSVDNNIFPPEGSKNGGSNCTPTLPHTLPHLFEFKDYAPLVFRALRARFGIDPADYMVSYLHTQQYIHSTFIVHTCTHSIH